MPPAVITFFEHQYRSYAEINLEPVHSRSSERILARLERINETAGQEIFHLERKGLRANAFVGVLRAGEFTFEIMPKIDYLPPNPPADDHFIGKEAAAQLPIQTATHNLLVMLSYAYDLRFYEQDIASLTDQAGPWTELLTRLFAANLHQEILSGLSQEYVNREENMNVLRGRWDIQRQLRQPDHHQRSFDVIYDDLSPDIPLNQVFRFVVEQLLLISQDPHNQLLLKELENHFREVTPLPQISLDLINQIQINRLNERFLAAFNLARIFLSGSTIRIAAGDQAAYAFVFDMNALFERFIAGFLTRHRQEILPAEWHDIILNPQSEDAGLYLARWKGKNVFRLRPDLLLSRREQSSPVLIADTKYKQLNRKQRNQGIAPEDVYQMLAYCTRYQCSRGLLIYPQGIVDHPVHMPLEMKPSGFHISAATLNLHILLQQPAALIHQLSDILGSFAND